MTSEFYLWEVVTWSWNWVDEEVQSPQSPYIWLQWPIHDVPKKWENSDTKKGQFGSKLKVVSSDKLKKLVEKDSELIGEMYMIIVIHEETATPMELQNLLSEYSNVFAKPKVCHLSGPTIIIFHSRLALNQWIWGITDFLISKRLKWKNRLWSFYFSL